MIVHPNISLLFICWIDWSRQDQVDLIKYLIKDDVFNTKYCKKVSRSIGRKKRNSWKAVNSQNNINKVEFVHNGDACIISVINNV